MKWVLSLLLCVAACADQTPPTVSGSGDDIPVSGSQGRGTGLDGGLDGGTDAGVDGGEPKGACDNASDLDAIESAGSIRDTARNCGLIDCANFVGNSPAYESCVSACVSNRVRGLSLECAACYGGAERCGHDWFCRGRCQNDTCSTTCLDCLTGPECILELEECRGLPGDGCPDTPP